MTITQTAPPVPTSTPDGRSFTRLEPVEAAAAQQHGALLVDIRPAALRRFSGEVPGALVVAGPVRDWRIEPGDPLRVCEVGPALPVVVLGDGSSASVLAASTLRGYGIEATDVIGGYPGWAAMSLPVCTGVTPVGHYVAGHDVDAVNLPCGVAV